VLTREHATPDGLRMKTAKAGSGLPSVTHDEAVEVALCYGWIDGCQAGAHVASA